MKTRNDEKLPVVRSIKRTPMVDESVALPDILPPQLADKVRIMLMPQYPYNQRENARNTVLLIRDALDKALNKVAKDFVRRT